MKPKTILLIDDEDLILEAISTLLQEHGWTTYCASNGLEGIKIVSEKSPSVILSDIKMPDMDGLEFLEKVHSIDLNTPVILLTGYRDSKKMQRAWEACVYDFLDKPYQEDKLVHVLETALVYGEDYVSAARQRFQKIRSTAAR